MYKRKTNYNWYEFIILLICILLAIPLINFDSLAITLVIAIMLISIPIMKFIKKIKRRESDSVKKTKSNILEVFVDLECLVLFIIVFVMMWIDFRLGSIFLGAFSFYLISFIAL